MNRKYLFLSIAGLFISTSLPSSVKAEDDDILKTHLLFHTLKKINWADKKTLGETLNFCSLTQNENSAVHQLNLKQSLKSGRHLLDLHFFYHIEHLQDYVLEHGCDIYYFDSVFSQLNIRHLLITAKEKNSITIGNGETFLSQDGIYSFISQNNKIKLKALGLKNTNTAVQNQKQLVSSLTN